MSRPFGVDLFCGLGGHTEGLLLEGWDVVGFDIERHQYGDMKYPAQLVIQDVLTLHGSQFKDADLIVASPPCQEFSYMAMPWSRAKQIAREYRSGIRDIAKLTALFDACFRIQREAIEAAGRFIPLVVENVKGAQAWVGPAKFHYGSFYLWGDIPGLMPISRSAKVSGMNWSNFGKPDYKAVAFNDEAVRQTGVKVPSLRCQCPAICDCQSPNTEPAGISNYCPEHNLYPAPADWCPIHGEGPIVKSGRRTAPGNGARFTSRDCGIERLASGLKNAANKFYRPEKGMSGWGTGHTTSGSIARKAASAQIAKIPLPLSRHIGRVYFPQRFETPSVEIRSRFSGLQ